MIYNFPDEIYLQGVIPKLPQIFELIEQEESSYSCLVIIRTIFSKPVFHPLLVETNLSQIISIILQNFYLQIEKLSTASSIFAQIFLSTIQTKAHQFFEISLQYFQHPESEVSYPHIQYISSCVHQQPLLSSQIYPLVFNRLVIHFSSTFQEVLYENSVLKLLVNLVSYYPDEFYRHLTLENLNFGQIAATFSILTALQDNFFNVPNSLQYINRFYFILELPASISIEQNSAYLRFCKYLLVRLSNIDDQLKILLLDSMVNQSTHQDNDVIFKELVLNLFSDFPNFKSSTNNIGSFIQMKHFQQLIQSYSVQSIEVISYLLKLIPKEFRSNLYAEILQFFKSLLPHNQNFLNQFLKFIETFGSHKSTLNCSIEFFQFVHNLVIHDDLLLSTYIAAVNSALEKLGFPIFLSTIQYVTGYLSMKQYIIIGNIYLKFNQEKEWVNAFFDQILPHLLEYLNSISNWEDLSDETKESRQIIFHFFDFLIHSMQLVNPSILEQTFCLSHNLFHLTQRTPFVIPNIILFWIQLPDQYIEKLIQNYVSDTFHILKNFSSSKPCIHTIFSFHLTFFNEIKIYFFNICIHYFLNNNN